MNNEYPNENPSALEPVLINASDFYQNHQFKEESFVTGIESLDQLFEDNAIVTGEIVEFIGLPSTGKTMLLNTIMINLLHTRAIIDIVYIDTRHSFQPLKLVNMMNAKKIPKAKQIDILNRIEVHQVSTADDLVKALSDILTMADTNDKVKMILINSITTPFYLYMGHTLLTQHCMMLIKDLMRSLTRHRNMTVS